MLNVRDVSHYWKAKGVDLSHIFHFFFYVPADPRDLHVVTHSFPTRRSSDLCTQKANAAPARSSDRTARLRPWLDRKSTRLNSSHVTTARMPASAGKKKKDATVSHFGAVVFVTAIVGLSATHW